MLEKIYQSYDDNNYYIDMNKKRLAGENAYTVGGMLTFFIALSVIFTTFALALGNGIPHYVGFLPAIGVLVILFFINRFVTGKELSFGLVRVYALFVYTLVIVAFSYADIYIYQESRAVFFPVAIVLLSALYMDYFWVMCLYKVVMGIAFIVMDSHFKSDSLFINDITVTALSVLASMFCFSAIIHSSLSRHEDSVQLVKKSQTDLLTGLLNKVSFEEESRNYLGRRVLGARCMLFIFDLDNFKNVNDKYGHQIGDKTLKLFSEILKGYFHPDDVIGRVGGDEFMVLVLGEMPDGFVDRRCRSIIHEFRTTEIDDAKGFTCSIGIVEDTQGHSFDELYKAADAALYKAKYGGKAKYILEECK